MRDLGKVFRSERLGEIVAVVSGRPLWASNSAPIQETVSPEKDEPNLLIFD
jgi:hypothetical protein